MKTAFVRHGLSWAALISIILLVAGCTSPEAASRSSKAALVQDAARYVSELKQQDKLPGYSRTEQGKLIALAPLDDGHVTYPATVTVRGLKDGDKSVYCYAVKKDTRNSPWRLVTATRLDTGNNGMMELLQPK